MSKQQTLAIAPTALSTGSPGLSTSNREEMGWAWETRAHHTRHEPATKLACGKRSSAPKGGERLDEPVDVLDGDADLVAFDRQPWDEREGALGA